MDVQEVTANEISGVGGVSQRKKSKKWDPSERVDVRFTHACAVKTQFSGLPGLASLVQPKAAVPSQPSPAQTSTAHTAPVPGWTSWPGPAQPRVLPDGPGTLPVGRNWWQPYRQPFNFRKKTIYILLFF